MVETPGATPLIETRGITMRFGGVVAVDNVDFRLAEGELRCLIGPNGAGKSTFFKCLTRQYKPTAGQIFFRGEEVTRLQPNGIATTGATKEPEMDLLMKEIIADAVRRLGKPVAMGYVASEFATPGTELAALVRGKALPARVAKTPFVPNTYFKG